MMETVPTAQRKQGKWPKELPVRENTGNLEILPERTDLCVCLCPKFPDFKDQGYCAIYCEISQFLNVSAKSDLYMQHPQITEICTGKICGRTGKTQGI